MQEITRLRALCCVCGNLRTVAANYSPPRDANRTDEADLHRRGWRCTQTLKCPVCEAKTCHALLRSDDDPDRDIAEEREVLVISKTLGAMGIKVPAEALVGLSDDDLEYADADLRTEAASRIKSIMTAMAPEELTLDECADLLSLLNSFVNRRGGVL